MDYFAFLDRIGMCDGGKEVFARLHKNAEDPAFRALIDEAYQAYDDSDAAFAAFLERFSALQQVRAEEANLYFYIHMCSRTYAIYRRRQIDDGIFYDTMQCFAAICRRCYDKHGVYGIMQKVYRAWYRRQLGGVLFRLGRLEFEIISSPRDVVLGAYALKKGDTCISVHIPAGAPLDMQACEAAYAAARSFFREKFGLELCVFFCNSWLLHPWLSEDLPESSRIVQFQKQYQLDNIVQDEAIVRDWLFDNDPSPYDQLPVKTGLHKAAVSRLQKRLAIGRAEGYRM